MRKINNKINKKIKITEGDVFSIKSQKEKIINNNTEFIVTEEYNALRTNILLSLTDIDCKVIGITSPNIAEGKTTVCLNSAVSLGKAGYKVLLIDGDLRAPKQSALLEIDGDVGLSNLLVNQAELSEALVKTKYENLNIIPSGSKPPNPSEMLGSETMNKLIEKLKDDYDYILIDLPPVNIVTDAVIASKYLNGLIVIVRSNYTKKEDLLECVQTIENANGKILGIVVNGGQKKPVGYNKKGRYYSYNKYQDSRVGY